MVYGARFRMCNGRGRPLSLTLSFDEIPWFDVWGEIQRCDWSKNAILVCGQYEVPGYGFF